MSSFTIDVSLNSTDVSVNQPKLEVPDVGTSNQVTITWQGINCVLTRITFNGSPQPPVGSQLPTPANNFVLQYTAPATLENWAYTVCAKESTESQVEHCHDPEIDNTNPW